MLDVDVYIRRFAWFPARRSVNQQVQLALILSIADQVRVAVGATVPGVSDVGETIITTVDELNENDSAS